MGIQGTSKLRTGKKWVLEYVLDAAFGLAADVNRLVGQSVLAEPNFAAGRLAPLNPVAGFVVAVVVVKPTADAVD